MNHKFHQIVDQYLLPDLRKIVFAYVRRIRYPIQEIFKKFQVPQTFRFLERLCYFIPPQMYHDEHEVVDLMFKYPLTAPTYKLTFPFDYICGLDFVGMVPVTVELILNDSVILYILQRKDHWYNLVRYDMKNTHFEVPWFLLLTVYTSIHFRFPIVGVQAYICGGFLHNHHT